MIKWIADFKEEAEERELLKLRKMDQRKEILKLKELDELKKEYAEIRDNENCKLCICSTCANNYMNKSEISSGICIGCRKCNHSEVTPYKSCPLNRYENNGGNL